MSAQNPQNDEQWRGEWLNGECCDLECASNVTAFLCTEKIAVLLLAASLDDPHARLVPTQVASQLAFKHLSPQTVVHCKSFLCECSGSNRFRANSIRFVVADGYLSSKLRWRGEMIDRTTLMQGKKKCCSDRVNHPFEKSLRADTACIMQAEKPARFVPLRRSGELLRTFPRTLHVSTTDVGYSVAQFSLQFQLQVRPQAGKEACLENTV